MAEKRKCLCCEKTYEYCPHCGKTSTPWKMNYDTEACKDLFNIISAYNMNLVKEDKIKEVIDKYSITDFSIYKESVRNLLNKLFSNKHVSKKEIEVEVTSEPIPEISEPQVVVEETPAEQEVQVEEEQVIEEAPRGRRRNRFFE